MVCYITEIGKFWDTADTTRVFNTPEKAMAMMPEGFELIPVGGYFLYAENKQTKKWFSIKSYEVE